MPLLEGRLSRAERGRSAQLRSLLDMLSTTPKDEVLKAVRDEDFIHPVIFAGIVFIIMIILLNLPAYVEPFIF
ncbi:hypothetical protein BDZ89DRAFT_181362 [Hymenopellis radicata]|nr:hypothetical protein BDZ89DRAFT_181362 [Hymenopellis radicata]